MPSATATTSAPSSLSDRRRKRAPQPERGPAPRQGVNADRTWHRYRRDRQQRQEVVGEGAIDQVRRRAHAVTARLAERKPTTCAGGKSSSAAARLSSSPATATAGQHPGAARCIRPSWLRWSSAVVSTAPASGLRQRCSWKLDNSTASSSAGSSNVQLRYCRTARRGGHRRSTARSIDVVVDACRWCRSPPIALRGGP